MIREILRDNAAMAVMRLLLATKQHGIGHMDNDDYP